MKEDKETYAEMFKRMRKDALEAFNPTMFYDSEYDIFNFTFCGNRKVEHTVEVGDSIRLDMDKHDEVISIEIEDFKDFLEKATNKSLKFAKE